jgi:hypothetical protein
MAQMSRNSIDGLNITLRYFARIHSRREIQLQEGLQLLHRLDLFFSLLMGRALGMEDVSLNVREGDQQLDAKIYGLVPIERSKKPDDPIVSVDDFAELAKMLNQWLVKFDQMYDAIDLHVSALEQTRLPLPLRFQSFIQAMEALHRRTANSDDAPIDVEPILKTLRNHGVPDDMVDRVNGILAHAHEPGLRKRLRHYFNVFEEELAIVLPELNTKKFIQRSVVTRNYYAHRIDRTNQILEGIDLWNFTELIKVISHLAILREVGGPFDGLGQTMRRNRFVEFATE